MPVPMHAAYFSAGQRKARHFKNISGAKKSVWAMEPRWRRGVLGLGSFPRGHAMSQLGIDLSEILTGILPASPRQQPLPDIAGAEHLNQFLNALPAAIYMTDADGRIT